VEDCTRRGNLCQPALDRSVDVLVGWLKREIATIELAPDSPQAALDRLQLPARDQPRGGKPAPVRDAARDVVRVELVVELERR
jgi:hypothetical protein